MYCMWCRKTHTIAYTQCVEKIKFIHYHQIRQAFEVSFRTVLRVFIDENDKLRHELDEAKKKQDTSIQIDPHVTAH